MAAIEIETTVRYLHILSAIAWIGLLYFFNLVNLPVFKFAIANGDPNVKGGPALMFRALFWFRWSAMATLIFGLALYHMVAKRNGMSDMDYLATDAGMTIGLGMALAIIMWFNVWFVIWPAQKVVLPNNMRIAKGVPDDEKARLEAQNKPLANRAKLASRINFWLSIPMLLLMVFAAHSPFVL